MFQLQGLMVPRFEHSHGGDEWHVMDEVEPGHDSAEHDPERQWQRGRVFKCSTCDDSIRVVLPEETQATAKS